MEDGDFTKNPRDVNDVTILNWDEDWEEEDEEEDTVIFGKTWAVFSKNSDLGGLGQIHVGRPARGGGPHPERPMSISTNGRIFPHHILGVGSTDQWITLWWTNIAMENHHF